MPNMSKFNYNEYSNISDQYPPQYYLSLKSKDFRKWCERWENMIWEIKYKYNHIKFENFPESDQADRGNFFKLQQNESSIELVRATNFDVLESEVWFLPGTVSSHKSFMQRDLATVIKYLNKVQNAYNMTTTHSRVLIFCPYVNNYRRYQDAMLWGAHERSGNSYYSDAIYNFTKKYFIPRLFNQKRLLFVTHSVGGREVYMIEEAARKILSQDYNFDEAMIKEYFGNVKVVLFGHAPEICSSSQSGFEKVIVLGASDQGVLIPQSLYKKIYKQSHYMKQFTLFQFRNNETLLFLGINNILEVFDNEINRDGHRLPHYLNSVELLPELIKSYLHNLLIWSRDKGKL